MSFFIMSGCKTDIDSTIDDLISVGYSPQELWDTLQTILATDPIDAVEARNWETAMTLRGFGRKKFARSNPEVPRDETLGQFWVRTIHQMR